MTLKIRLTFLISTLIFLTSCNSTNEKNKSNNVEPEEKEKSTFVPNETFLSKHSDSCKCSAQFELKDSMKLVHVKDQFYKSKTGHLYERTIGLKEVNGHLHLDMHCR